MTTNAYRRALYGTIIHVSANVVTLLSICLAMYMSFHYPNDCLTVFCAWFFGITVSAWFLAKRLDRYVRLHFADADEGLVRLPGKHREMLMRWKVCARMPVLARLPSYKPSFSPPVYPVLRWMPAERSSRRHSGSAGFACTRAYFVRHHRSPRRTDFHQGLPPLEYGHPTSSGFSLFRMGNSSCRRIRSSAGFFCVFSLEPFPCRPAGRPCPWPVLVLT